MFPEAGKQKIRVSTLHHYLLSWQNDETWRIDTLPAAAQPTTLNVALQTDAGILLGGNKTLVQPRLGRQDGAALQLWDPKTGNLEFIDLGGERNRSEVRQLVKLDDRHVLVLVGRGEYLVLGF